MDGNVDVHSCTCKRDWHGRLLFAESISGFYSFGMHLDITSYYQKMKRMGEKNHSSDRHLDQEVQAKCVCVCMCETRSVGGGGGGLGVVV